VIGCHDGAVRCIEFCSELNLVISGGWDSAVKLWDPRSNTAVGSLAQPDRVCKHNDKHAYIHTYIHTYYIIYCVWQPKAG